MGYFSYRIILLIGLLCLTNSYGQHLEPESITLYSPELDTTKVVWILLPKDTQNTTERYPVLYMHDAQNLFDASRSYAGEWQVDETIDSLHIPCIVVAIEHGNEKRIDELTPYTHEKYGGGKGKAYSDFIVNTVKPMIDSLYPTLPGKEHTLVGGSSLGGLISHYMLFSYPEVFSKGILFSPSYWYSEKIYDLTETGEVPENTMIYLASGAMEPGSTVADHERMAALLKKIGFSEQDLHTEIREGAAHNEDFWKKEFPKAMSWYQENYFNRN